MFVINKIVLVKKFSNTGISNGEETRVDINPYNFAVEFFGWKIDSANFMNGVLEITVSEMSPEDHY